MPRGLKGEKCPANVSLADANQNPASARFGVASGPSDSPLSIVRACRLVAGGFAMEPGRDAAKAGDHRDCQHLRADDD
jgi:hypothetical protein